MTYWEDYIKLHITKHDIFILMTTLVIIQNATEQPALVIVYFGGNDSYRPYPSGVGPHVPLEEYIENMRKIAIHIKVNIMVQIVLLSYYLNCYYGTYFFYLYLIEM